VSTSAKKLPSFRVGKVKAYQRNKVWYLCYYENGLRRRPKVGTDRDSTKQMAAQINAQLETGAPALLSFENISITDLRERWLQNHEQVLRSSVQTIRRYRAATEHLLNFVNKVKTVRHASQLRVTHAEEFTAYLRALKVSPNGHANSEKRALLDKGIKFILETCRALFTYAAKRRHLSPYTNNPFSELGLGKIPIETHRSKALLTAEQELEFLSACGDWQFPIFVTLMLTGMRPGELTHLMLSDLDFGAETLMIRNRPQFGWQVKTRNERVIPVAPELKEILRRTIGSRTGGTLLMRPRFSSNIPPPLATLSENALLAELHDRKGHRESELSRPLTRAEQMTVCRTLWRDCGAVEPDRIRMEFMRVTEKLGFKQFTEPKILRHMFATSLQDANVDPLIRNELMGHSPEGIHGALGMTAVYTHTRPETRREQLLMALERRPILKFARQWLQTPGS
jgi:integrase